MNHITDIGHIPSNNSEFVTIQEFEEFIINSYIRMHPGVPREQIVTIVRNKTDANLRDIRVQLKNPICHETTESSMLTVFNHIKKKEPIVSANGTLFKQHEEFRAPSGKYLADKQIARKVVKKKMLDVPKGTIVYLNLNIEQGNIKVTMNSFYGGSGTTLSPFYSAVIPATTTASAKNMTTTLICSLEFLTDNTDKYAMLKDISELFDMINVVLSNDEIRTIVKDTYTPEQVYNRLRARVVKMSLNDECYLMTYISSLKPTELTRLMLAFNVRLALDKYLKQEVAIVMNYIKSHHLDYEMLSEISTKGDDESKKKGKDLLYDSGFGVEAPADILATVEKMKRFIINNCIYPFFLNDPEVRSFEMHRNIVCTVDTDSLMVHFAAFLNEMQTNTGHITQDCMDATALGIRLFVEPGGIIYKQVEYYATNTGIKDPKERARFVFKNEFIFLKMALFARKMYACSMFAQEGSPRNIHDIAVTGLSFKKSDSAPFLEPLMLKLYDKYVLNGEINVNAILDVYYQTKKLLVDELPKTTQYYKLMGTKQLDAYSKDKILPDHMRGSVIWNGIFDDSIEPLDKVYVIPLNWDKLKNACNDGNLYAPKILDQNHRHDPDEKHSPILCLPEDYHEIPEWLSSLIDINKTSDQLLSPFKQLLGLFDIIAPDTVGGIMPSRMMYL